MYSKEAVESSSVFCDHLKQAANMEVAVYRVTNLTFPYLRPIDEQQIQMHVQKGKKIDNIPLQFCIDIGALEDNPNTFTSYAWIDFMQVGFFKIIN